MTGAPGPGWTTRGPSVAAGRLRVITSLAFAGSFAVGGSWAIAMPWDGGPDEQAHITRAAGWSGEASPRRPTTGRAVRLGGRGMAVQGRYILPTAVGAALLAASIADERGLPFAARRSAASRPSHCPPIWPGRPTR